MPFYPDTTIDLALHHPAILPWDNYRPDSTSSYSFTLTQLPTWLYIILPYCPNTMTTLTLHHPAILPWHNDHPDYIILQYCPDTITTLTLHHSAILLWHNDFPDSTSFLFALSQLGLLWLYIGPFCYDLCSASLGLINQTVCHLIILCCYVYVCRLAGESGEDHTLICTPTQHAPQCLTGTSADRQTSDTMISKKECGHGNVLANPQKRELLGGREKTQYQSMQGTSMPLKSPMDRLKCQSGACIILHTINRGPESNLCHPCSFKRNTIIVIKLGHFMERDINITMMVDLADTLYVLVFYTKRGHFSIC